MRRITETTPMNLFARTRHCIAVAALATLAHADTLTGTVVNQAGLPIAGATVVCNGLSVITTATGTFSFTVPSGVYSVDVAPPAASGLATAHIEDMHVAGTLNVGNMTLVPGVTISGLVLYGTTGLPVPNGDMDVIDAATGQKLYTPSDNTALTGIYTITVPPGTYKIVADPATAGAATFASQEVGPFTVTANTTIPTITLQPGFQVTATILRGDTGLPLKDCDVDFDIVALGQRVPTPTDLTNLLGVVTVVVPAGTYRMNIDPAPGDAYLGQQIAAVTVTGPTNLGTITLATGNTVSGYVRGNGVGVPKTSIELEAAYGGTKRYTSNNKTAHDGWFRVVMPGDACRFDAIPPANSGFAPAQTTAMTAANVVAAAPFTINVPAGGVLSGTIYGLGGVLAEAAVSLNDPLTGALIYTTGSSSNANGVYSRLVPNGTWNATIRPHRFSFAQAITIPVLVNGNTTLDVNLPFPSAMTVMLPAIAIPPSIPNGGAMWFDFAIYNVLPTVAGYNVSLTLHDPSNAVTTVLPTTPFVMMPGELVFAPSIAIPLPILPPTFLGLPHRLRITITDAATGLEIDRDEQVLVIS